MLDEFEKKKRREMTEIWKRHLEEHKDGFKMFSSRLYEDAPVLVIGYNPGGELYGDNMNSRMKKFVAGDFSRPAQVTGKNGKKGKDFHPEYFPHWAVQNDGKSDIPANLKWYVFHGKQELLKQTVETNRYYMRSDGTEDHKRFLTDIPEEVSELYETFCRETTQEVIRLTNPEVVIDYSGKNNGHAEKFCNDLGFDCESITQYTYKENYYNARVSIAEILEPPHATVISLKPHLGFRYIDESMQSLFRREIPHRLPEIQ